MINLWLSPETVDRPSSRITPATRIPVLRLGTTLPDIQFEPGDDEFTLVYLQALGKAALGLALEIERARAEGGS
jgi:hypothetical protein